LEFGAWNLEFSSSMIFFSSSNKILTEGVYSSSYCPALIDQMNKPRKPMATSKLTAIKIKITFTGGIVKELFHNKNKILCDNLSHAYLEISRTIDI
jgi:hypothetical protein